MICSSHEPNDPILCGGATVFNPLLACNVRPTDRGGVIGLGGLSHLALQSLPASWARSTS